MVTGAALESSRRVLDDVAQFVSRIGAEVVMEKGTSEHLGLNLYPTLTMAEIGKQCDLGLVVGGDGTMLGIGRQWRLSGCPSLVSIKVVWALSPTSQ